MISRKLVLVLGAGASRHIGFPLGWELTKSMYKRENNAEAADFHSLLHQCGFGHDDINSFRKELQESAATSVDAFLEHRTDFLEIGKAAMAIKLLPYERLDLLFREDDENWYRYLFSKLNCSFEDFGKNQLAILTFNYDRSLEFFLCSALQSKYKKSLADCCAVLNAIPIAFTDV